MKINKSDLIKPKKYESPMAIPPGETIKEFIDELGMTQKEFAIRMDISEKHLTHIIKGSVELTRDIACKLELILGIESSFWLNLENSYREALAKFKEVYIDEEEKKIVKEIPYNELAIDGWVESTRKVNEKVINLRKFFAISDLTNLRKVNVAYRKANICHENKYALLSWVRIAELQAQSIETQKFSRKKLIELIPEFRKLTLIKSSDFYKKLVELCATAGIALVVSKHLKGTGVHGVTFLNSKKNKLIIQLSVRGKAADKFWFTFFHEISHILYDEKDNFIYIECDEETEKLMDIKAANLLIPNDKYEMFVERGRYSIDDINSFAQNVGIHPCIVVGRLKYDRYLPYTVFTNIAPKFEIS